MRKIFKIKLLISETDCYLFFNIKESNLKRKLIKQMIIKLIRKHAFE